MLRARALRPPAARVLAITALFVLGACGDQQPSAPRRPAAHNSLLASGPKLLTCPSDEARSESAVIGASGGLVQIGATKVVFPAGALLVPTTVTLTIPESEYVEIDIETDGAEYFPNELKQPVVTIDYSRCQRGDLFGKQLTAWYIDAETKELLEKMASVDNKLTETVTFTTSHFSGYAIAF